jgi:lambda repressor-like predicted transcriptional regulator
MEKKSKTQIALALVRQGKTPYAAAKEAGIATSTLYTALKRQEDRELCPCCGQVVREGFEVNRAVLKKK